MNDHPAIMREECDVLVVGGGPAGLAAAAAAAAHGAGRVVVIERKQEPGGILPQCIHPGFGLRIYGEDLTGPEYARRAVIKAQESGAEIRTGTVVLEIAPDRTVYTAGHVTGLGAIRAGAIVLAMGCRERTREALGIPGTRPAGIFTAGAVQYMVNIQGRLPGRRALVLGSGDIGLIMARRLSLEGVKVEAVIEIASRPGGLLRNVVQCLHDFDIPLLCDHTVTEIHGRERLEAVTVARVGDGLSPVAGTERIIPCDTLLLSVGLIPENELSRAAGIRIDEKTGGPAVDRYMETSAEGVFACGNALHVSDIVDKVTEEGETAGRHAARFTAEAAAGVAPEKDNR